MQAGGQRFDPAQLHAKYQPHTLCGVWGFVFCALLSRRVQDYEPRTNEHDEAGNQTGGTCEREDYPGD